MTPFRFQTAQKTRLTPRSSVLQFENSITSEPCSITEQCTPSYVLTVYYNLDGRDNVHMQSISHRDQQTENCIF